jgi:hypothetical protein
MDATEFILLTITLPRGIATIEVKPFRWKLWYRITTWEKGHVNDRRISVLWFDIYYRYKNAEGKAGDVYRAELKRKGEWNG